MPWWFYDLECNSRVWIVTHIWYMSLSFETIMNASMTRNELTDINCSIKFCKCVILKKTTFCECWDASVILWSWVQFRTMNCHSYTIYDPKFWNYYDASMTQKELTICSIKFCKCRAASQWFDFLECNYRLWIVPQIWYMSLCFETIMMNRWPEGIDGYKSLTFETIKMPRWPERNWRILFVPLNFVKCDFKEN